MLPAAAEAVSQPSRLPSQVKCVSNPMFEPTPLSRVETPPFDEAHECLSPASSPVQQQQRDPSTTTTTTFTSPTICCQSNLDDLSPHVSHSSAAAAQNETVSFDLVNSACECVGGFLDHCCTMISSGPAHKCTFDALCEPKISIAAYFSRIRQYSQATPESIVCALVLMRRIYLRHFVLTNFNVHRLLVASVMVFAKYYDDETDSNARWARIAGLKKCELNNLEVEFLNLCHFDLRVSPASFHSMVMELIQFRSNPPSPSDRVPSCPLAAATAAAEVCAKKTKSGLRIFHSRASNANTNATTAAAAAQEPQHHRQLLERTHTAGEASKHGMSVFHTGAGEPSRVQCSGNEGGMFYAPSVPVTPSDCNKKKLPRNTSLHSIAGLLQKSPSIFKRKHKTTSHHEDHDSHNNNHHHHHHHQEQHQEQPQHASHVQPHQ